MIQLSSLHMPEALTPGSPSHPTPRVSPKIKAWSLTQLVTSLLCLFHGFSCLFSRLRVSFIFWRTHPFLSQVVVLFSHFSKSFWCLQESFRKSFLSDKLPEMKHSKRQRGQHKGGGHSPSFVTNSLAAHRCTNHRSQIKNGSKGRCLAASKRSGLVCQHV